MIQDENNLTRTKCKNYLAVTLTSNFKETKIKKKKQNTDKRHIKNKSLNLVLNEAENFKRWKGIA